MALELARSIPGAHHVPVDPGLGDHLHKAGPGAIAMMLEACLQVRAESEIMPGMLIGRIEMYEIDRAHQIGHISASGAAFRAASAASVASLALCKALAADCSFS